MPTSRFTAFQLFIKQALQYPLASPFLPAEAYVKKDVSYGANQLIGEYEGETPALEWQTEPNVAFAWLDCLIYAQYLEADGVTVAETPQNIWRLPTNIELVTALCNAKFLQGTGLPTGFVNGREYYNDSLHGGDYANTCGYDNGYVWSYDWQYDEVLNVRCVKI